jgi:hypothetical protein
VDKTETKPPLPLDSLKQSMKTEKGNLKNINIKVKNI